MANNPGDSSAQSGMMNRGQGSQGGSGTPGGPGTRGGPGSQSNNFAPGSVDDTLARFCTALAEGDTAAASEFISAKAKALAGKLRDGELSDEQIEEITDAIVPISELQPTANSTLTKRGLRNGKNQSISFTLKKEDDSYKITEFTVSKPKKPIQ